MLGLQHPRHETDRKAKEPLTLVHVSLSHPGGVPSGFRPAKVFTRQRVSPFVAKQCCPLWVAAMIAGLWTQASAGLPARSPSELADRLAAAESRLVDADLEIDVKYFDTGPDGALVPTPYWSRLRWVFRAPYGTRLYQEETYAKPWREGPSPIAYARVITAFDGSVARQLWWDADTEVGIAQAQPSGAVSRSADEARRLTGAEGYRLLTSLAYGVALSAVVRETHGVAVDSVEVPEAGRSVYRIQIPAQGAGKSDELFYVDPERGFAIVRWEALTDHDPSEVWDLLDPIVSEVAPGVWLPVEAWRYTWAGPRASSRLVSACHFTVSKVAVNSGVDDSLFTIDFPPGTPVLDRDTGRSFIAGHRDEELDALMQEQTRTARQALAKVQQGQDPDPPALDRVPQADPRAPSSPAEAGPASRRTRQLAGLALGLGAMGLLGLTGFVFGRAARFRKAKIAAGLLASAGLLAGAVAAATPGRPRASSPPTTQPVSWADATRIEQALSRGQGYAVVVGPANRP